MPRTVSVGAQDFEELLMKNNFYVDKTHFIREWWESDRSEERRVGKECRL